MNSFKIKTNAYQTRLFHKCIGKVCFISFILITILNHRLFLLALKGPKWPYVLQGMPSNHRLSLPQVAVLRCLSQYDPSPNAVELSSHGVVMYYKISCVFI